MNCVLALYDADGECERSVILSLRDWEALMLSGDANCEWTPERGVRYAITGTVGKNLIGRRVEA